MSLGSQVCGQSLWDLGPQTGFVVHKNRLQPVGVLTTQTGASVPVGETGGPVFNQRGVKPEILLWSSITFIDIQRNIFWKLLRCQKFLGP